MNYKYEYTHFIPENVAPKGATKIIVKDSKGEQVGFISSGRFNKLSYPKGEPLYSFGVFSDVHVNPIASSKAATRFKNAVKYLADVEKVKFICIAGDLTGSGTEAHFKEYIELVTYSKSKENCDNAIDIHDTTGNHDVEQGYASYDYLKSYANGVEPYNKRRLWYSFTEGNDLFIMFGMYGWPGKTYNVGSILFSDDQMNDLEDLLEKNKDKRCFFFTHPPYFTTEKVNGVSLVTSGGSGAIIGLPPPTGNYIGKWSGTAFKALMRKYTNVIYFHGHTHMEFFYQEDEPNINYCLEKFDDNSVPGIHSIHIPSLAVGRELNPAGTGWQAPVNVRGGEGYIVDVYENHIVLRGRDFANEKFSPIATYYLETK